MELRWTQEAAADRETVVSRLIKEQTRPQTPITFLAAGEKEARAWTIDVGETASNAASSNSTAEHNAGMTSIASPQRTDST